MLKIYQQTIKKSVNFEGVGLHTGKKSNIKILPGKVDEGIIFKRIDLHEHNIVQASYKNVTSAKLCTTLENEHGVKVSTVEHLLAALYIAEIDNAIIEIDNEEIPIMDGSAKEFLKTLRYSEIKILNKKRKYLEILEKIELSDGKRKISIEPSKQSFQVDFQLSYENKVIGNQKNCVNFQLDNLDDIKESRTFCLFEDIEKIKKAGLAKGGSLENAIVVEKDKVLNKDGLRNNKEFVNHKILDLVGDFILSGGRVLGKVTCVQGGHELTNAFLRKIFTSKNAYKSAELEDIILKKNTRTNSPIGLVVNA